MQGCPERRPGVMVILESRLSTACSLCHSYYGTGSGAARGWELGMTTKFMGAPIKGFLPKSRVWTAHPLYGLLLDIS